MSYKKQHKSKERIDTFGEVYTNEKEIDSMLDLVHSESYKIDSTFLEPACGNGNFLIKILERKLKKIENDYEKNIFIATCSLYGIDIQKDNVLECRKRLYDFIKTYINSYQINDENLLKSIKYILNKNIICGNALTGLKEDGGDIIFSEWCFETDKIQIKEYSMRDIIDYNKDNINTKLYPLQYRSKSKWIYYKEVYTLD